MIAATKAQVENIPDLDDETAGALLRTAARIARTIEAAFHPDGITMMQTKDQRVGKQCRLSICTCCRAMMVTA